MKAHFADAQCLKQIVDGLRALLTEANLVCDADGLRMQGMDAAHVALAGLTLRADGMEAYECPAPLVLGLHLASLHKILSVANPTDRVRLEASGADRLRLTFEGTMNGTPRTTTYALALMEIDVEDVTIPEGWGAGTMRTTLPSAALQRVVRDLGVLGSTCRVCVDPKALTFKVAGALGEGSIALPAHEGALTIVGEGAARLDLPLRHLQLFAKATAGLTAEVGLAMASAQPLRVTCEAHWGRLVLFLAPLDAL